MKIRDHVQIVPQPAVVRLDQLHDADSRWISDSYYITVETEKHFKSLKVLLSKETGCGIFLIGHYGSGKSHFLAYLTQQLQAGSFVPRNPAVLPLSLLNYKATQSLESILYEVLAIMPRQGDRRLVWKQIEKNYPEGLFLILDELSEFLRSKPSPQSFNEDLRFLQFLGEWAEGRRTWILAALQEQIEHTGEMEYDLYSKIKDRYPIRLLLTPAHVKDLIAQRILRKQPSYRPAVEKLAKELMRLYPDSSVDFADFCEIYPLHPVTLELLEEVRDRFSQARGVIDFALTQLLGNEARGVSPFLDQPWGHILTPDVIVDHFADLFEVQSEFLAISQKVLPYFRKQMPALFERRPQQDLAWRLIKLLILVHLSPRRKFLHVDEAAQWLLLKVSSIDETRNREVIKRILDVMAERGAFLKRQDSRYSLDLEDDSKENLEQLLSRTVDELQNRGDSVFESLVPGLGHEQFNPFTLPRDRWHTRRVRWHFHERDLQIYFGGGIPPEPSELALQIGLPWGPEAQGANCFRVVPDRLALTPDILELAALYQLRERPLPARVLARVEERIAGRSPWFCSLIRAAYGDADVIDPTGASVTPPLNALHGGHNEWLNTHGEWMLKQTYPQFERFAPGYGPLHREVYRQFMKYATDHDLASAEAPDFVKLIREAYLVPMGLMQRRGSEYFMKPKLEGNELVRLLAPIVEHHPTPTRVYQHLSAPVYGLVPDQIHLLLLVLLIQGEIDIVKGERSYREMYETLINPLQYDKIVPGRALNLNQLRDLQILCEGFHIPIPKQWSVMAQKRAIDQLRKFGSRQRDQLSDLLTKLKAEGETGEAVDRIEKLISLWLALDKGDHELQGFQHFIFAIGSLQRFLSEAGEMALLPERFERLLRETGRFRHLFGYPCLTECADPAIAADLEALQQAPSLTAPEALENWLARAQALYQKYQRWYRARHEQWLNAVNQHRLWSYQIPRLSRSRQLGLGQLTRDLEALQTKARQERCSGLGNLDFQPLCRCGFDGRESPLSETLRQFESASNRLESELALFFQQDRVKSRVRQWVDQGIEVNTQTLSYLEEKANYPEVENLALFDQHLAGLELVQTVESETLLDLLAARVWEKSTLMKALDEFFGRLGPRIALRREEPAPREDLIAWCCEQALRQGCPLPPGFSPAERKIIAGIIKPEWVSEASLQKLEQMSLGEEAIRRILEMILAGLVRPPQTPPCRGPVAAALTLLKPAQQPTSAEALAEQITCLYEQNERLLPLRPQLWLTRLNELAETPLVPLEELPRLLGEHLAAQWIVIDCLGLPLFDTVRKILPECFPHWKLSGVDFALVSQQSSTDAFYRSLIEGNLKKSFEKINAIDALIHGRKSDLGALARLARAELEIAFKRIINKLDTTQPVLIFGDHGFRLGLEGSGFSHGGPSTLERITPVFVLRPFR